MTDKSGTNDYEQSYEQDEDDPIEWVYRHRERKEANRRRIVGVLLLVLFAAFIYLGWFYPLEQREALIEERHAVSDIED